MEKTIIDKKQAQKLMQEVLAEISDISKASDAYCLMIDREYKESNLHFLKELLDMFGMDEKHKGIGLLAEHLESLCVQVNDTLEELFADEGQA
jgi:hypothetical protein